MDKTAQRMKKTLAALACACLLLSGLPAAAFAADDGPGGSGGGSGTSQLIAQTITAKVKVR